MPRVKQKKITTRLNYNYPTNKGYQVLFEILNYADKNFRIKVLDSKGGIIHLGKDQVKKDHVVNHPKEFQINTYLEKLKHRTTMVLEFLHYVSYPIDKQTVERYLYKQIGDVYNYFEYVEDGEDHHSWIINDRKTSDEFKKEAIEQLEFEKRVGIYRPLTMLEALKYYKPDKIDTRLASILEFYCYKNNLTDIKIDQFSKDFIDKIIWHCINNGYNKARKKGKIIVDRYTTQTLPRVVKMLRAFGKFLLKHDYKINKNYVDFELTKGKKDSHIKYIWNDKRNVYTLYKREFDILKNFSFDHITDEKYRNKLINTRDLFLMQTYGGGLRINELFKIESKSFIELNGKKQLVLIADKTKKIISNPVSDQFNLLLEKYNNKVPTFNTENEYNDNLKLMAKEAGLNREILQFENYVDLDEPIPYKVILHDVFSSKLARKALVSILYNMGEKKEYIATITNHTDKMINYYIALEEDYTRELLEKL